MHRPTGTDQRNSRKTGTKLRRRDFFDVQAQRRSKLEDRQFHSKVMDLRMDGVAAQPKAEQLTGCGTAESIAETPQALCQ